MSDTTPTPKTVIGPDTHIKGEMTFDSGAVILGRFDGSIQANGEIEIGESARCAATVRGERVIIDGKLTGDAIASDQVRLNARAKVEGDLTATTLVVAEGASFHGMCSVGPEALKNRGAQPERRATPIHAAPSGETETKTPEGAKGDAQTTEQPWDRPMVSVNPASSLKSGLSAIPGLAASDDTPTRASA